MNNILEIKNLSISYGDTPVIRDLNLNLEKGKLHCLLGESGSGKTTLLRAIAGFQNIQNGQIKIDDVIVNSNDKFVDPHNRGVAMVLQEFALFPHINVAKNITYGISQKNLAVKNKVLEELLELTRLKGFEDRMPSDLSGGQQQRVAIARALAVKPKLLLLDEPFSNLDTNLAESMKIELKRIIRELNISALVITHDQEQAFDLSQSIALINQGKVLQHCDAFELYHKPTTKYAAKFIGKSVFIKASIISKNEISCSVGQIKGELLDPSLNVGDSVDLLLRPEDIVHDDDSKFSATVIDFAFRGHHNLFYLMLDDGTKFYSIAPSHHHHLPGSKVGIKVEVDHLVAFKN